MTTGPQVAEPFDGIDTVTLRRAAAEAGLPVSDRLLETLRSQGLAPRPVRVGHRGRSPAWVYPRDAIPQLLALMQWRQHTKDPDTLRLLLWVDGYPISTADVRVALIAWLERTQTTVERELRAHADRRDLDLNREEDQDEVLGQLSRALASKRGPGSVPRRVRVPAAERVHAVNVLLRRFLLDMPVEGDVEEEAQTIEKVLGLTPGRTRTIGDSGPWLTGPAAPLLEAANIIALPRLLDSMQAATDQELELARQTVRAMFQFLPFMVRMIGVLTGDDNYIGMAGLRDVDQNPEVLFQFIPMIVAMLRAGWTENLSTVTAALNNFPELAQQAQNILELPSATLEQNLAPHPPETQERIRRLIDGAISGELDLAPRRPARSRRRP